jgi:5-methylcytosine-specific restriction endonuclease McrA
VSRHTPRSAKYRKLCAQVKQEEPICWLCGHQIDPLLRWPDPMSYSTDHIKPTSTHPHLAEVRSNMRAAHLVHNQQRQTGKTRQRDPGLTLLTDDF